MEPLRMNAIHELVSAMSSLNTETTYKGPSFDKNGDYIFIADAEPLAKHSQEHISAAIDLLIQVRKELGSLSKYIADDKFLDYLEAISKIEAKI